MFSYEYCEIFKNTFFCGTPPVATSAPVSTTNSSLVVGFLKKLCYCASEEDCGMGIIFGENEIKNGNKEPFAGTLVYLSKVL